MSPVRRIWQKALVITLFGTLTMAPVKAAAGSNFFEATGVGIASGAVLGLSTMPFYDEPMDHWGNVLYGAIAGMIVGMGVALFTSGSSQARNTSFENDETLANRVDTTEFKRLKKTDALRVIAPRVQTSFANDVQNVVYRHTHKASYLMGSLTLSLN